MRGCSDTDEYETGKEKKKNHSILTTKKLDYTTAKVRCRSINLALGGSTMRIHSAYYTHTCQILKIKGLQCKRLLLCRLHKYKKSNNGSMDSHCMHQK